MKLNFQHLKSKLAQINTQIKMTTSLTWSFRRQRNTIYVDLGLPCLRNLVTVYTSSNNRNDSIYTELPDLIFSACRSIKSPIFFLEKLVPCANIRNCLVGCCDRTHFKYLESDCNMRRLVYYRHLLQLQLCN